MKHVIYCLAAILLFAASVNAQALAYAPAAIQAPATYTPASFASYKEHGSRLCVVTKVGFVTMGAGFILVVAGLNIGLESANLDNPSSASQRRQSNALLAGGIAVFAAGAGMAIGGAIHDIGNRHKQRLGLVAPKSNELGLAVNF